jgi:peptidoglycan/xylan/chitin deacetylase (PgdA/CDA1 family)
VSGGAATNRATIVMYHYIRRLRRSRFPRLTALDLDAFRGQLKYIGKHYSSVSLSDVAAAARGDGELPPRPIALTFDDGYAEHYHDVVPLLHDAAIPGAFFPAASSLLERRVLDVNKIQFVLAASEHPEPLVAVIDEAVERSAGRVDVTSNADYRAAGWKPMRFDEPAASYVKYMLQGVLPDDMRTEILNALFTRFVSADERAFADELYFTGRQAAEMAAAGMTIGCHADRHVTLTSLTRDEQTHEIDGALRVLDAIDRPRSPFVFSYAKGAYNTDSVEILRSRGCTLAVTNRPSIATLAPDTVLTLPRLDANHLPIDPSAPANEWTRRA